MVRPGVDLLRPSASLALKLLITIPKVMQKDASEQKEAFTVVNPRVYYKPKRRNYGPDS